jgi:hypothetical protein
MRRSFPSGRALRAKHKDLHRLADVESATQLVCPSSPPTTASRPPSRPSASTRTRKRCAPRRCPGSHASSAPSPSAGRVIPPPAISATPPSPQVRRRSGRPQLALKPSHRAQLFKSNCVRSLSAIVLIMSHRSASCGPSIMITTFQVSSWGATEMAKSVGHSDVFHLQPDGGFEFFPRFCRLLQPSITGLRRDPGPPSTIRAGPCLKSGREPLAIRYRRRPPTAGDGPSSQRCCGTNVPTEYAAVAAGTFLPTCSFSFRLDVFR